MQAIDYHFTIDIIGGTPISISYESGYQGYTGPQGPGGRTSSTYNGVVQYGDPGLYLVTSYPTGPQHGTAVIIPPSSAIMQYSRVTGEWRKVGEL